jgi:hypothetical protein
MNKGNCQSALSLLGVTEDAKSPVTQTLKSEQSELLRRLIVDNSWRHNPSVYVI